MSGLPYQLKENKKDCEPIEPDYTDQYTATIEECFKFCRKKTAVYVSYGRKNTWACNSDEEPIKCRCRCFLKECAREIQQNGTDLYKRKGKFIFFIHPEFLYGNTIFLLSKSTIDSTLKHGFKAT